MSHQETRLIFKHIDEDGYTNDIDCYMKNGGYDQLKKAVTVQPEDICAEVLTSGYVVEAVLVSQLNEVEVS